MAGRDAGFYITGGTLPRDALSYVARRADEDLYQGLSQGEFCYVLTARQMGKSSLMVRTATRLAEEGARVVVLDLTGVGQNLNAEQWYDGLLNLLGHQLDLEDELEEFWLTHKRLGPLQRFTGALRQVALPKGVERLVIFIDEIDAVRSLPFSTDEFFAAIRECYNRRTTDPAYERLTFCLLGVATPADLIRDTRSTPFNIGRRIELGDFTEEEARPLGIGLEVGELGSPGRPLKEARALLKRILHWTGGHPYLTQRLCRAVAHAPYQAVDRLCEELFFVPRSQEREDNLLFVRERLLRSEADLASLLDLYERVRSGRLVLDDDTNPLVSILRLSGIVRLRIADRGSRIGGQPVRNNPQPAIRNPQLRVRNRIYARVFDRKWVRLHMPGAELRRQRAAYRRGLARATALAVVVLATAGSLGLVANRQRRLAVARGADLRRNLYAADMSLAQQALDAGNMGRARQLLEAHRPRPGEEDLRGFEWRHLWQRTRGDDFATLGPHGSSAWAVAFSADGRTLATGGQDGIARLWRVGAAGAARLLAELRGHREGYILGAAFSPDGRTLATGGLDATIRIWDVASRREVAILTGHTQWIWCLAFSPDGRTLASGGQDSTVRLWDLGNRSRPRAFAVLRGHQSWVRTLAFSRDGKTLVSANNDSTIRFWSVSRPRSAVRPAGILRHPGGAFAMALSPDGRMLATGGSEYRIRLWDLASRMRGPAHHRLWHGNPRQLATPLESPSYIWSLAFSADGTTLAVGGDDGVLRLCDVHPGSRSGGARMRYRSALRGHGNGIWSVAFAPDGATLATASWDGTAKLWSSRFRRIEPAVKLSNGAGPKDVVSVAFAPDGRMLAAGSTDGRISLLEVSRGAGPRGVSAILQPVARVRGHDDEVCVDFAPDGRTLASVSFSDPVIRLWRVERDSARPGGALSLRQAASLSGGSTGIALIRFSPDGKLLATAGRHGIIRLLDVDGRRAIAALQGHRVGINAVAFSPDGRLLASAGAADVLRLWDVAGKRAAGTLGELEPVVYSLAFSPDGTTLAVGLADHSVKLWNVRTRTLSGILGGHPAWVNAVDWAPDGRTLAAACADATVRLWNVSTWREVAMLRPSGPANNSVHDLKFSRDGNLLAAGCLDGTLQLWPAATFAETDGRQARD